MSFFRIFSHNIIGVIFMNTFLIFVQALATVVIAIYAYSNYKLSKIIKNENQEILDYLTGV